MNLFQYLNKPLFYEYKKNEFESKFIEIKDKINTYKKQYELTTKSYLKEWESELKNLNEIHKKNITEAQKIYDETIKDTLGNINDIMWAEEKSNLRYINHEYSELKSNIEDKYRDFFDLFSKAILTAVHSLSESELLEIVELSFNNFPNNSTIEECNKNKSFSDSINFLIKKIGLESNNLKLIEPFLLDSKLIRNRIVHSQSKARTDAEITSLVNIEKKHKKSFKFDIQKKEFKIITTSFLDNYFKKILEFYHQLFIEIEKKQNYKSIYNQLKNNLLTLDNNIIISKLNFEKFTINNIKSIFYITSENQKFSNVKCVIELQLKDQKSFNIICNNKNKEISDFLKFEEKNKGYFLSKIFSKINISEKNYKTKIYIGP